MSLERKREGRRHSLEREGEEEGGLFASQEEEDLFAGRDVGEEFFALGDGLYGCAVDLEDDVTGLYAILCSERAGFYGADLDAVGGVEAQLLAACVGEGAKTETEVV